MKLKKFYGAEDAGRFAATITNEWQTEEGEIWDDKQLIDVLNCADGENPLDEEDEEIYYVVDENGAVGYTEDDGKDIYWYVTPTRVAVSAPEAPQTAAFCPFCGAPLEEGWAFCDRCGKKL